MFGSGERGSATTLGMAGGDEFPVPISDAAAGAPGTAISTGELAAWSVALRALAADVDDAERIDQLRLLEELKSAAAAAQALVTAAFARSQRAANGVPDSADPGAADPRDPSAANSDQRGADLRDPAVAGVGDQRAGTRPSSAATGAPDPGPCPAGHHAQRRRRAAQAARSICSQVALARKDSPRRGGTHVGLAEVLVYEMPRTLAALARGTISEWRATLICRETAGLSGEQRARVDEELDGQLAGAGDRRVAQLARAAAYRIDPDAVTDRAAKAASDRRVTIRPAPDTMAYVSVLLPIAAGVAVFAELRRAADSAVAAGDGRSRSQLMADFAVNRILHPGADAGAHPGDGDDHLGDGGERPGADAGDCPSAGPVREAGPDRGRGEPFVDGPGRPEDRASADPVAAVRAAYAASVAGDGEPRRVRLPAISPNRISTTAPPPPISANRGGATVPPPAVGVPTGVGLEIGLVVTDRTLFGGDDEPALLDGEVIPAGLARALVSDLPVGSKAWIRRLYTRPRTGQLVSMDSRRRLFDGSLRRFVLLRDQRCRTPWCDAPIRHADHVQPAARGGPTAVCNADGLSEDCNYTRETPGWRASVDGQGAAATVTITTPTGHRYTSAPPALHRPGRPRDRRDRSA